MRKKHTAFLLIFGAIIMLPLFLQAANKAHLFIKLSRHARINWGYLSINNRPYVTIRKGATREYTVYANRRYKITIKRRIRSRLYLQTKIVYLRRGENKYLIFKPVARYRNRYGYLYITHSRFSKLYRAHISINRKLYAYINRGRRKKIKLPGNRWYSIFVTGKRYGRWYYYKRRIFLKSGKRKYIIANPIRSGGR